MQELLLSYSEGVVELIVTVVRLFKGLQVMEAEAINQGGKAAAVGLSVWDAAEG